jgi:diaminopimelate epimerase
MNTSFDFLKMEGLGNDFIVTHEVRLPSLPLIAHQVVRLCDRRRGIGADGLICILPSKIADFKMKIFNSDGSEAEMCGNGVRCCAVYVKKLKLSGNRSLSFETGAGTIVTELTKGVFVRVTMGKPVLSAPQIPTMKITGTVIMEKLPVDDRLFKVTAVSMGNPHAVIYDDHLTDELVLGWGKKIENHHFFPNKTNVEFVKVLSPNEIRMRVWERGCGETLACGTGACASVVSGILNKLHGNRVTVHLPGGDLLVEWDGKETSPVYMTGPARITFKGSVEINI